MLGGYILHTYFRLELLRTSSGCSSLGPEKGHLTPRAEAEQWSQLARPPGGTPSSILPSRLSHTIFLL